MIHLDIGKHVNVDVVHLVVVVFSYHFRGFYTCIDILHKLDTLLR